MSHGLPFRVLCFCTLAAAAWAQPRRNIILVSLDQLQADRLHSYGNPRETSPNLGRMAREGVRFEHFYSAAPGPRLLMRR